MTATVEVRHHRGRSGQSVYRWRVYLVHAAGTSQRGKFKDREAAEEFAVILRESVQRTADAWAALKQKEEG